MYTSDLICKMTHVRVSGTGPSQNKVVLKVKTDAPKVSSKIEEVPRLFKVQSREKTRQFRKTGLKNSSISKSQKGTEPGFRNG